MTPKYFDVHSHLTFKDYDQDLEEVLQRMKDDGVWTLTVGVNKETSEESLKFVEDKENFFVTVGLHPNDAPKETFSASEFEAMVKNPKTVAIGECGLDYYRITGDIAVEKKRQFREFEKQLEFAIQYDKPMMIHCRPTKGTVDAYKDMADILESKKRGSGEKLRGNMHFFVGDVDVARRFYAIGFTTSFTGVLTFARDYDEVVRFAPLDMILTETDAPFASPQPFRGRRNEPSYVKYVVEAIASIREEGIEKVRMATVQNALRLFSI